MSERVTGWLPIGLAPRGVQLILYFPADKPSRAGRVGNAAMIRVDYYPVTYPRQPTHFMPLPPPPSED